MQESEQWWLRSLEFYPNSPKSLAALADICYRSGRLADALQIFQRLLTADPENLVNYSNCASLALKLGNIALAEDALRRATVVDKSGYADLYLARFQFELGKFPEAAQNAGIAAERSADVEAYLVLIAAQQALGKPALAFEALRKARGIAPNDPRLLNIQL
jgi:tetratricopeptide (TPR) repeat protein